MHWTVGPDTGTDCTHSWLGYPQNNIPLPTPMTTTALHNDQQCFFRAAFFSMEDVSTSMGQCHAYERNLVTRRLLFVPLYLFEAF